ncbi:MAG: division/cell wall cluster transcriptional repressor MraZ [Ancrocorticia sp.]|nr:division/cell wall cluster transcriptional repressor MraZ [Ancrocorticia sp.]MCI1895338.1 division/cell wall cluster transcriptional repressor MraZ [Ancrocorticia sp.]MCI1932055.1 division/cell wall cluster transcriptional repressor MraZ [Ancrocorticia sp.]MCI1963416.1 division/cell wall cluster transcriptional repressor MraZ [Ancrocorticia sp.]MCI2002390.1 division/cell wall cluster transcriptional repressor MraZ [Ancrocorticia sp.]
MFLGTYEPKLDDKGRLILPAKYREQLQGGLVMTRGQEHCLYVFPASEFAAMHEQLRQAPLTSKEARSYLRVFLSGAVDDVPDKQGRVSIPAGLRQWAHLERDLAVIGAGNRIEIWDLVSWNEYLKEQESAFADREDEVIPGLF